jgi:thiamine-monophosphate kinase
MPERELVRWIRRRAAFDKRLVPIGPGDDAALVTVSSPNLLVAIDTIAEGVDFTLAKATPAAIGRKALAVNLSDIAAMGGIPSWCLASVNLRECLGGAFARGLASGLLAAARKFKCPLVGGDITGWKGGVVVTVAIAGTPAGKKAITRAGARPGDIVFVTGTLGGSILGKHLSFTPRLAEAKWLATHTAPTAMIDISDGLGVDAAHVADESRVAMRLDAAALPISAAARRLARTSGKSPLHHAISDGEDFELLFTLPRAKAPAILRRWPFRTRLTVIGRADKGRGVTLTARDGTKERIDAEGYEHL